MCGWDGSSLSSILCDSLNFIHPPKCPQSSDLLPFKGLYSQFSCGQLPRYQSLTAPILQNWLSFMPVPNYSLPSVLAKKVLLWLKWHICLMNAGRTTVTGVTRVNTNEYISLRAFSDQVYCRDTSSVSSQLHSAKPSMSYSKWSSELIYFLFCFFFVFNLGQYRLGETRYTLVSENSFLHHARIYLIIVIFRGDVNSLKWTGFQQ